MYKAWYSDVDVYNCDEDDFEKLRKYVDLAGIQCTIWVQLIEDTKFVIASHAHTITIPY